MTHRAIFSVSLICFFIISYAKPELIVFPFQTVGKTIIIQGKVDGQQGNLIFDTGLPKMLINKDYVANDDLFTIKEFEGLRSIDGGDQQSSMSLIILEIGEFTVKIGAEVVDLGAIEKQKGMNILGVIGIDLFRKYELEIDGYLKVIRLHRLDKKGNRTVTEETPLPSVTIPFQNLGHLACFTANLNGVNLNLGLDTGAEFNILPFSIYKKNRELFQNIRAVKMMDINGNITTGMAAQITGLNIGTLEMPPMATVFVPHNTHYGSLVGKKIQGLLGFEFFQRFRIAINFKKKEVYIWNDVQEFQ